MKAKKTSPKSIRFNIKDLEAALVKSGLESTQELVDFLLKEYTIDSAIEIVKSIELPKPVQPIKDRLSNIVKLAGTKNYFQDSNNLDGISDPSMPF